MVAIDNVEQENFREAHRELGSKIRYEIAEVYELRGMEPFDYVLFLGVLYHLRHPLLALDIVCELTKDIAIVDSFVVDDDHRSPIPWMEFYEGTELSNQVDNWVGPTIPCLMALCRSAGFARVELLNVKHRHARLACYRRWEPPSDNPSANPPELKAAVNGRYGDNGINFKSAREEFITCWFTSDEMDLGREDLRPEVSGFGAPVIALQKDADRGWHANFKLPPGLKPGWHEVRLRTAKSAFSNPCKIAVDVPFKPGEVEIRAAGDGRNWQPGEVHLARGQEWGHLTLWIAGLSETADRNNVRVYCDSKRLPVDFVSSAQVNARIPSGMIGAREIFVQHGEQESKPVRLVVKIGDSKPL